MSAGPDGDGVLYGTEHTANISSRSLDDGSSLEKLPHASPQLTSACLSQTLRTEILQQHEADSEQPGNSRKNSLERQMYAYTEKPLEHAPSGSSTGTDDLLEQLLGNKGVPVESFRGLVSAGQPSRVSYLDPDFDIGIPYLSSRDQVQSAEAAGAELDKDGGLEEGQQEPVSALAQLRTCSEDDEDCQVNDAHSSTNQRVSMEDLKPMLHAQEQALSLQSVLQS